MSEREETRQGLTGGSPEVLDAAGGRTQASIAHRHASRAGGGRKPGEWPRITVPDSWPAYGTNEWYALDTRDPRKRFALFEAAERWRLQQLRQRWLDSLDDADWYAEVFGDARRVASQLVAATNRIRSFREIKDARAKAHPPHHLRATPGWPPIRIPGGDGRYLTYSETRHAA